MKRSLVGLLLIISSAAFGQVLDVNFRPQITGHPEINALAWQPDGKVIIAGNIVAIGTKATQRIVRLNADGSLDESFNAPKLVYNCVVMSITVLSDGKILVAGSGVLEGKHMIRLNANGTHDPSFVLAQTTEGVFEVEPLENDHFLIFGSGLKPLFKITANGALDNSFVSASPDSYGIDGELVVQPDGKILVGGTFSKWGTANVSSIVRLNADGSLDNSFSVGTGAKMPGVIKSMALMPDGKIVAGGMFESFNEVACKNLVKLLPDGTIDPGFILPGPVTNLLPEMISNLSILQNSIIAAGSKIIGNDITTNVIKLKADGAVDPSFTALITKFPEDQIVYYNPVLSVNGTNILFGYAFYQANAVAREGIVMVDGDGTVNPTFNPQVRGAATLYSAAVQPDGKIILGGNFKYVGNTPARNLTRLNADGSLDGTFQTMLGQGVNRAVRTIQLQTDSKILVGGDFEKVNGQNLSLLFRLNADGSKDNSFNSPLLQKYLGVGVNAIQLGQDGKMIVGGAFSVSGSASENIVRLQSNGALDTSFGYQLASDRLVSTLAQQSNGNLLVGGRVSSNNAGFLSLITSEGSVLNNFSNFDLSNLGANVIRVLPDDSFVFGGNFTSSFSDNDPNRLIQMTKNGTVTDQVSLAVYRGAINDIQVTDYNAVLLAGEFAKVNQTNIRAAAKVRLNGYVSASYDLKIDGSTQKIVKASQPGEYYYIGSFTELLSQSFFNIARINVAIPTAPTNLSAQKNNVDALVTLSWSDISSDNETGFAIYRSANGAAYVAIDSVAANIVTFADLSLQPVNSYSYKVRAFNLGFQSDFSNEVNVSTASWIAPTAPKDLTYEPILTPFDKVTLKWTDMSDNESGFEIERAVGSAAFTLNTTANANFQLVKTDFDFDQQFSYRMRAYNRFGKSAYSNTLQLPIIMGVGEEEVSVIGMFPNPATSILNIELAAEDFTTCSVLYLDGRIAMVSKIDDKRTMLDIEHLTPGIYFLKLTSASRSRTLKLVKR